MRLTRALPLQRLHGLLDDVLLGQLAHADALRLPGRNPQRHLVLLEGDDEEFQRHAGDLLLLDADDAADAVRRVDDPFVGLEAMALVHRLLVGASGGLGDGRCWRAAAALSAAGAACLGAGRRGSLGPGAWPWRPASCARRVRRTLAGHEGSLQSDRLGHHGLASRRCSSLGWCRRRTYACRGRRLGELSSRSVALLPPPASWLGTFLASLGDGGLRWPLGWALGRVPLARSRLGETGGAGPPWVPVLPAAFFAALLVRGRFPYHVFVSL